MPRTRQLLVVSCSAFGLLVLAGSSAAATSGCDRWAAPGGSDRGSGRETAPFRTVQRLVDALRPGQAGCLESGTYRGAVQFNRGGARGAPLTLTEAPGQQATIVGRMWIPRGSSWVSVSHLHLDGVNGARYPSPTINSAHDQFVEDDVTDDHTGICFELGSAGGYGRATDALLESNRIHDCGVLPAENHDHGIYLDNSVGARIVNNWIYDNADRGIQLYPNAQDTTITGNVLDHNGEGILISGEGPKVSSNNLITGNVITNSTVRADVESYWPTRRRGTGNVIVDNCVYGGKYGIDRRGGGFQARDNVYADPGYVDPGAENYSLSPASACTPALNRSTAFAALAERRRAARLALPGAFGSLQAGLSASAHGQVLTIDGHLRDRHARSRRVPITVYAWVSGSWRRIGVYVRRRGAGFRGRCAVALGTGPVRLRVRVHLGGSTSTALLSVEA